MTGNEKAERVGSGITARRRVKEKAASVGEAMRAWVEHFDALNSTPSAPWERHRPMLDEMRKRHAEIFATQPAFDSPDRWDWQSEHQQERHSEFWYLNAIRAQENLIDHHLKNGGIGWAIHEAILLGELITELRMKACWEAPAMFGETRYRELKEGAQRQRKMGRRERHDIVADLLKTRRRGVRDAARIAAQKYPAHGSASSFKTDYYEHRKVSKAVD